jgi:uncharacterized RDD family membrane protein YckC
MPVEGEYGRYRNFWRRFSAAFIDGIVLYPVSWLDESMWGLGLPIPFLVLWFLVSNTVGVAYSVVLHGLFGQTIGKRAVGVRVYDVSGGKLSFRQAVLRDCFPIVVNIIAVVAGLSVVFKGENPYDAASLAESAMSPWMLAMVWSSVLWLILELTTMFLNPYRRALHDLIAGSVVMRVPHAGGALASESDGA